MVAILPLLLLSGAFAGKHEIDAIGQRDQERRFMDEKIGAMKTQAAMAAWQLEREQRLAREDDDSRRGEQGLYAQMAEQEMRKNVGVTGMETIDTGLGPLSVPKLGDTQPGQTGMLAALQRGLSEGRINPEVARIALPYAQSEDTKKAVAGGLAHLKNAMDFAQMKGMDPSEVEPFMANLELIAGLAESKPEEAVGEASKLGSAWREALQAKEQADIDLAENQGMIDSTNEALASVRQQMSLTKDPSILTALQDKATRLTALGASLNYGKITPNQYNQHLGSIMDQNRSGVDMQARLMESVEREYTAQLAANTKDAGYKNSEVKLFTEAEKEALWNQIHARKSRNYGLGGGDQPAGFPNSDSSLGGMFAPGSVTADAFVEGAKGMSKADAKAALMKLFQSKAISKAEAEKAADALGLD